MGTPRGAAARRRTQDSNWRELKTTERDVLHGGCKESWFPAGFATPVANRTPTGVTLVTPELEGKVTPVAGTLIQKGMCPFCVCGQRI